MQRLQGQAWLDHVEAVQGNALDRDSLVPAMQDVSAAYYLIHGMQGAERNAERDLRAAQNFAAAADETSLKRIIYLGELADPSGNLSLYLRSRHETGDVLRQARVPITEFRAGMIVGAGSVLFEMIRYLTEREPILICPRWFFSLAQPISISDVLAYLVAALQTPECAGKVIEIGGATQLSYADMLLAYAAERDLKRLLIPAPVFAPRLSAFWVHMVTPIHWRVVLPLIQGLHAESVVRSGLAKQFFPQIHPLDYRRAVRSAVSHLQTDDVETSWSDALVIAQGDIRPIRLTTVEGMMIERRSLPVNLPPRAVFRSFTGLGGDRGWLFLNWVWRIRGWIDKLVGGVGLRRGRRHPDELRPGESLDFWRVEALEPNSLLRLRAEMKVPGRAWLEFQSIAQPDGMTILTQTAYFAPRGLSGFLYWYVLYPIHTVVFGGLIRKVAERASQLAHSQT
jgi:uncharacterized protein YbjT (DUF2867 family)